MINFGKLNIQCNASHVLTWLLNSYCPSVLFKCSTSTLLPETLIHSRIINNQSVKHQCGRVIIHQLYCIMIPEESSYSTTSRTSKANGLVRETMKY